MNAALESQIDYLLSIHRASEAVALAAQGLQHEPMSVSLLILMARAQLGVNNPAAAIEAAQAALRYAPDATAALLVLADGYSLAGDNERAVAAAEAAVQQAPHSAWPFYLLASVRNRSVGHWALQVGRKSTRDELDRALAEVVHAIEIDPSTPAFHVLRGEILARTHHHQAAREAFAAALQLDPTNERALAELAAVDVQEIRLDSAERHVADGLVNNPQSKDLQRRSRELLRVRLFLPLWVATLTPTIAALVGLRVGHPSATTTSIVVVGTVASVGFVVWWWRKRLTASERNRFLHGDLRRALVIASVLWALVTVGAFVFMRAAPTVDLWFPPDDRSPTSDSPPVRGADVIGLLSMAAFGAGVFGLVVIWLYSRSLRAASKLGDRLYDQRQLQR